MERVSVYGAVLAGGIGSRMREGTQSASELPDLTLPKQFMPVGEKPILIHSLEIFSKEACFESVMVLCPAEWIQYTEELIEKYLPQESGRVDIVCGGETRNETIMRAIEHIENNAGYSSDTILVTHDAARPFVTGRMIRENIEKVRDGGACDTVVPATDTIVISEDDEFITRIPERRYMYRSQTPQTFRAEDFRSLYGSLTDVEKGKLTDACGLFVMKGEKVHLVMGEESNIKVTYPQDLAIAEALLK